MGAYLALSLFLAVLLAWFGRRDLLRLSNAFGNVIDQQRSHADALERQAWQRSGQTALAERSIGQQGLNRLGRATLDFIADYTGAAVGAMYARDEDGSLQRIAGYGAPDADPAAGSATLLSQALQSKKPLVFGELPEHYLKVSSSLGHGSPRHIVLFATDNDAGPNGVIELGYLQLPPPRTLDFLELVAPNIGRAIEGALARRRLQDALAEQEELRTANEELEEQSRVLEESQTILENQKAELEQTNDQLAEQANALDQKNTALGVVQGDLFGGDVVGCPRAGHRRHHEAVAQGQAGEVVGLE